MNATKSESACTDMVCVMVMHVSFRASIKMSRNDSILFRVIQKHFTVIHLWIACNLRKNQRGNTSRSPRGSVNAEVPLAEIIFCPQWTARAVASLHFGDRLALPHGAEKSTFQTILSERGAAGTDAFRHVFVRIRNFHFAITSRVLLQLR